MDREELLKPTLSGYSRAPALYHSTGLALSAFFGGPVGAVVYAAANTYRLGRIVKDLPILLALLAVAFLVPLEIATHDLLGEMAQVFGDRPSRSFELLLRALGLACFGAIYLMHRRFFRAASVSGVKPLAGWLPGISAVLTGLVANTFFIGWILKHH